MANKTNKQRVNRYRFGRKTGIHSRKWKNRQRELLLAKKGKVSETLSVFIRKTCQLNKYPLQVTTFI